MPHASDVQPTSHDRHDTMLVAALAAGDLAATDRDQAIGLTRSCTECATLHDDLVAIARATTALPAPFAAPPRDFRLTPADAARLRPRGWRRLVAALSAPRQAVTRPLGVGLTTLGLVGLLIGNVQLGTSASIVSSAGAGGAGVQAGVQAGRVPSETAPLTAGSPATAPAASMGPGDAAGEGFGPQSTNREVVGSAMSPVPSGRTGVVYPDGPGTPTVKTAEGVGDLAGGSGAGPATVPAPADPLQPRNVIFGAAIVLGLSLLVAGRLRSRRPA